ncbi:MAG: exodeoxyribonuclease III [Candidatus Saccharibacteria bacterium]|nr:exodeoxyribonuclease III [Candidatus Saccharibacteria bacterium]
MRLFSWNVNGIRAVLKKGDFEKFLAYENPDILCLQETKAKEEQSEFDSPEYKEYWNSAERKGYAGTAIFLKNEIKVLNVFKNFEKFKDLKIEEDSFGNPNIEGRILTLELEDFFVVTVYVPNSKRGLERLKLRETSFDPTFNEYLKRLQEEKPVVVCGDFNAAHEEIDLARPKENMKNAGFTAEERQGITNYLSSGLIDTFRELHPTEERYTWWSHFGNARANNVGWRIDYFFISKDLKPRLKSAEIYESVFGSDHCPISIELSEEK